jgi:hypothetical protein
VDEGADPRSAPNHAYGANRLWFEEEMRRLFPHALILRLPALFGHGLKKNVLFDLMHAHRLEAIDPRARFQWYDLARLWDDVAAAERAGLRLANLAVEPVMTGEIVASFFPDLIPRLRPEAFEGEPSAYDMRTRHAAAFGGSEHYVMDRRECLARMADFLSAAPGGTAAPLADAAA